VFVIAFSLTFYSFSIAYFCVIAFIALHSTCHILLASFILVNFSHSSKKGIEHLNSSLEEFRGEVLELLIGNSTSLLVLSSPFSLFILIVAFSHSISISPVHPPSR